MTHLCKNTNTFPSRVKWGRGKIIILMGMDALKQGKKLPDV